MGENRSFTRREVAAILIFTTLAVLIGFGSYRTGQEMAGHGGGADMAAAAGKPLVNGQTLFASNCAWCHGAQAQGGIGPALSVIKSWPVADFASAMLHGKAPGGRELAPVMPHFAEVGLDGAPPTDEQVEALQAYIKQL